MEPVVNEGSSDELGYILLEDCEVALADSSSSSVAAGKWTDLQLRHAKGASADGFQKGCSHCDVTIYFNASDGSLQVFLDHIPFFDGNVKPGRVCDCGKQTRSDASLTMGMLRACDPVVVCKSCKLLFRDYTRERASLIITLSFPFLVKGEIGSRSILPGQNASSLRLNSAMQSVLSFLRSDWEFLDLFTMRMEEMFKLKRLPNEPLPSVFPPKLTLEEMYSRLNDSPVVQELQRTRDHITDRTVQPKNCHILGLPKETLAENLAPFLTSSSINSLRRTCIYLHKSLEAVVPGLKLRLYRHQIKSLIWMRKREASSLMETDLLRLPSSSPHAIDGDAHRAATCGLTARLAPRSVRSDSSDADDPDVIRVHQISGREVDPSGIAGLARNVARGGLLCDDPGLGKTITVLSLLLQTAGMAPSVATNREPNGVDGGDERLFQVYWKEEYAVHELRRAPLLRLFNSLVRSQRLGGIFPVAGIRKKIDMGTYGAEFAEFERDVEKCIFGSSNDDQANQELVKAFREITREFKLSKCRIARKSFSNATAKPNSPVAALVDRTFRAGFLRSLLPSKATLLVVPAVLLDHWEAQIRTHIDLRYLTFKKPLIFSFNGLRKEADEAAKLVFESKTHSPIVFLDRGGGKSLPTPEFLAMFQFVITTNQRFENEWKNGSFQQEIRREGMGENTPEYLFSGASSETNGKVCPLLKVLWHRVVVDEGHSMAKDRMSSGIDFASWLAAERRWAMTGTPTTQRATQIVQVRALFRFLRHDFFTKRCGGDEFWKKAVAHNWKKGSVASYLRLKSTMKLLMKRHTKKDLEEIPVPLFRKSVVPMSFVECNTYNTLVSGIQSNILLTSMEGKTSGKQDSLLHRNNAKHARKALANIRRVCVGWSRVVPSLTDKLWKETVDAAEATLASTQVRRIRIYLHEAETEGLSECDCCSMKLSTLLIMSCCGSLICTECMDGNSARCVQCDEEFDVDEFQRFQPGFELTWKSNMTKKRQRSIATRAPEILPRHVQIPGSEMNLIIRQHPPPRRTRKFGDGHACDFRVDGVVVHDGKCILCREEHKSCNMLNDKKRCVECGRLAEDCPEEASKAHYLVEKVLGLCGSWRNGEAPGNFRPLKIIVFSQFREALNFVGDLLLRRFGAACIAEYWGRYRRDELRKFTHEPECFCLLLTKDGSEGLDLSCTTHIFFLEEIWDKALEDQAVARAWRMGAKGRVEVETLLAENTVEQSMQEAEKQTAWSRTSYLLRSLRLSTDYHRSFANPIDSEEAKLDKTLSGLKRSRAWADKDLTVKKKKPRTVRFQIKGAFR